MLNTYSFKLIADFFQKYLLECYFNLFFREKTNSLFDRTYVHHSLTHSLSSSPLTTREAETPPPGLHEKEVTN